jgi:ribose 5-phosphate isomerase A
VPVPQLVERLAGYLPVVIEGDDWEEPAETLDDIFLGDAEIW